MNIIVMAKIISSMIGIKASLVLAVCSVESDFRNVITPRDGGPQPSVGICQIKPSTADMMLPSSEVAVNSSMLKNKFFNMFIAASYLKWQKERYKGDIRDSVSAYNMGTAKVSDSGDYLNQAYVDKVFKRKEKYERRIKQE